MTQPLFQLGNFISHAGNELEWKIECDALTEDDWECLAKMIADRCQFGGVYGIPTGGTKLGNALEKYRDPTSTQRLIVDDVYTTGISMKRVMTVNDIGFVVFARTRPPIESRIRALFTLDD